MFIFQHGTTEGNLVQKNIPYLAEKGRLLKITRVGKRLLVAHMFESSEREEQSVLGLGGQLSFISQL